MRCERCNEETNITRGSMFDTAMCCMECIEKERKHPKYQEAKDAEFRALLKGDYNFPGIGLPDELRRCE